ncbi:MAG: YbaL family putative K(+) efflux transporter [Gemmatimonadaceae bacterium]
MPHETALIATIAAGFGAAFLLGLIAARLGLPPIVGYLLAGMVVGPFTPGFVADTELIPQLAELGVILLMFGVGLHFSVRDLLAVRGVAVPGAIAQIVVATALGAILARLWGWSWGGGLVFGLTLSVASTVVLLRALEARDALDSPDGRIAVGWLVVEDLATVLVLVLLPALAPVLGAAPAVPADVVATSGDVQGLGNLLGAIAATLAKVVAFVALMVIVGRRAVPWLLEHVARLGSRELFTLAVLATAIGIAVGASELFGVSFALGAFFAGVVINESDLSHRAAQDALPLQDAFAVLFFVSVGMLFDPSVLVRSPLRVVAVLAIIVIGKSIAAYVLVRALRYPARTALTVAAALGQIGEFSFILIGLAAALGLVPEEALALVVAGAILSITLNPPLFSFADWVARRRESGQPDAPPAADASSPPVRVGVPGTVVLVGHGRVGSTVAAALAAEGLPYVVVEEDERVMEGLRRDGVHAVHGDATRPPVLERAGVEEARLLIVTAPEPFRARRIIELAREMNPGVEVVVRTHSAAEQSYLEGHLRGQPGTAEGNGRVVYAERELALSLSHYALVALGRTDDEADARIAALRRAPSEAGEHSPGT